MMSRRSLRAMRARWERDLARLEAAYPPTAWSYCDHEHETVRNLATAIAEIDGIISARSHPGTTSMTPTETTRFKEMTDGN